MMDNPVYNKNGNKDKHPKGKIHGSRKSSHGATPRLKNCPVLHYGWHTWPHSSHSLLADFHPCSLPWEHRLKGDAFFLLMPILSEKCHAQSTFQHASVLKSQVSPDSILLLLSPMDMSQAGGAPGLVRDVLCLKFVSDTRPLSFEASYGLTGPQSFSSIKWNSNVCFIMW